MTPIELESLRRLHEALLISNGGEEALLTALNTTWQHADVSGKDASVADADHLNARMKSMLAMVAYVKEPLAVVKIDAGCGPQMISASGGAAKLIAPSGDPTILDARIKDFLKMCCKIGAGTMKTELWTAKQGESYRLNCVRIASDQTECLLLIRFSPGNPVATTEAELEAAALRRGLTPSEAKVFVLMARGLGNKEIARELKTSYHTIRAHLRNMFKTLKVSSRVEAIAVLRE